MSVLIKSVALLFLLGSLAACNTFAGVGEDLQGAGSAIEEEANEEQMD